MSLEKIQNFIEEEVSKREVSGPLSELQKEVYEHIVIQKAKILSYSTAIEATKFVGLDTTEMMNKLEELKQELTNSTTSLVKKAEDLFNNENKENLVKIVKKTKFINNRKPVDHTFFQVTNQETQNILVETANEELLLLSPYKAAAVVQSEQKNPSVERFLYLYNPATEASEESEIKIWIDKYKKTSKDEQQVLVHFSEISSDGIFTEQMVNDISRRWSVMIGLSGNMAINQDTKEPEDKEMFNAVQEVTQIIKNNCVVF